MKPLIFQRGGFNNLIDDSLGWVRWYFGPLHIFLHLTWMPTRYAEMSTSWRSKHDHIACIQINSWWVPIHGIYHWCRLEESHSLWETAMQGSTLDFSKNRASSVFPSSVQTKSIPYPSGYRGSWVVSCCWVQLCWSTHLPLWSWVWFWVWHSWAKECWSGPNWTESKGYHKKTVKLWATSLVVWGDEGG